MADLRIGFKRIKRIAAVSVLLMVTVFIASCGKQESGGTDENSTVLNVAIVRGNDRFMKGEGDQSSGIEPHIASLIADTADRELKINIVDNETALFSALQEGQADVGFGRIPDSDSSLKSLSFSRSYGRGGIFFVTKKYDYTDSLSLMLPGTVGVTESVSALADTVPGIENFKVESYSDTESLARDVEGGVVSIGIVNEREALGLTSDKIQYQEVLKGPKEAYVAVMPKDSVLAGQVDAAISAYYDSLMNPEEQE